LKLLADRKTIIMPLKLDLFGSLAVDGDPRSKAGK